MCLCLQVLYSTSAPSGLHGMCLIRVSVDCAMNGGPAWVSDSPTPVLPLVWDQFSAWSRGISKQGIVCPVPVSATCWISHLIFWHALWKIAALQGCMGSRQEHLKSVLRALLERLYESVRCYYFCNY